MQTDKKGYFGEYGGRFVPETLIPVLDELEAIAPVMAVRGNGDMRLPPDPRLKDNLTLNMAGICLGLSHWIEYPEPPWRTLEEAMQYEFGGGVDIIVFGDTHVATVETHNGVLLVNPGSPSIPRGLVGVLGTVAILDVTDNKIEARIILLPSPRYPSTMIKVISLPLDT